MSYTGTNTYRRMGMDGAAPVDGGETNIAVGDHYWPSSTGCEIGIGNRDVTLEMAVTDITLTVEVTLEDPKRDNILAATVAWVPVTKTGFDMEQASNGFASYGGAGTHSYVVDFGQLPVIAYRVKGVRVDATNSARIKALHRG